jgi:hypothetical protein
MADNNKRIASNLKTYIRSVGGPSVGGMLACTGCYDPASLDALWSDDQDDFETYFNAYRAIQELQASLSSRSQMRYFAPSEKVFTTLKVITENMANSLALSFLLEDSCNIRKIVHLGLASKTVDLLDEADLDRRIVMEFLVECAIALRESTELVRVLESMVAKNLSKEDVMDAVATHANGCMLRLIEVTCQELVA